MNQSYNPMIQQGLIEILREASNIINAIDPAHAPANIRWPIVDELDGFAIMIDELENLISSQGYARDR